MLDYKYSALALKNHYLPGHISGDLDDARTIEGHAITQNRVAWTHGPEAI